MAVRTKVKLENFLDTLESLGYIVEPVTRRPQVYLIDNERVNIRSRERSKAIAGGVGFWYSVAFSVLQEVKWVIYLTTGSDNFVMLRSSFLDSLRDHMYPDNKKPSVGIFDIDWTEGYLVLRDGKLERIWDDLYDLSDPRHYPDFSD